jgi:ribose transport system substrate-binding protein
MQDHRWTWRRAATSGRARAALGVVVVSLLIASCSSSDDDGNNDSNAGTPPADCNVDAAQAVVDEAMKVPEFEAPGPAFDASAAAGKSVVSIPQLINPFNDANEAAMADAAKLAGVDFQKFTNDGKVTQYVQGFEQALANGVDGIDLFGADARQLQPQIQAAHDAGVVVQSSQTYDNTQVAEQLPELKVDAMVTWPYQETGKVMADWIIADSKCDANVSLIFDPGDVPASAVLVGAMKDEFKANCPSCKLSDNIVSVFDWATKLQGATQTALVKDPDINYVVPIYDAMTQWVVPAVVAAGKADSVKAVSCSGTSSALQLIKDNNVLAMDIGTSFAWEGFAVMDNMLRLLTGNEPLTEQNYPIRAFTADNVDEALPDPDAAFGTSYIDGYKELWQLN